MGDHALPNHVLEDETYVWKILVGLYPKLQIWDWKKEKSFYVISYKSLIDGYPPFDILMLPPTENILNSAWDLFKQTSYIHDLLYYTEHTHDTWKLVDKE